MPFRNSAESEPPQAFESFRALFERTDVTEHELQEFMEMNTEVIPVPILLGHDLQWNCVISQFEIDRDKIADFAYISKDTGQWLFVFVELERPQKRLFVDKPYVDWHRDTRQAIAQIERWKTFEDSNRKEIVRRLCPLMRPRDLWDNPIDIQYILVIGRNPDARFTSPEHSGRVKRLAEEGTIHLYTYDSVLRMGPTHLLGLKKNVLSHRGFGYGFKSAQADTNIFAHLRSGEIEISTEQTAWFASRGYDMKAWKRGKLLE